LPTDDEKEVMIVPEGQVQATLVVATLSRLMLSVAKELFPQRAYFDLTSPEKQIVADHVRKLLGEAHAILAGPELLSPSSGISLPPQRDEEYL
jgi:hypothetical protein